MEVRFAHLCDYASISREGKLSIMGIFDQINATQVPVTHPQAFVAFELELNYAEVGRPFTLEIQVVDEDGNKVVGVEAAASIKTSGQPHKPGSNPRSGQLLSFNNLKLERFGTYNINIFLNSQLKKQLEFKLMQAPPK